MTKAYLRSTSSVRLLSWREIHMKGKLLKVAAVLTVFAAAGLADFPLGLLGYPHCC